MRNSAHKQSRTHARWKWLISVLFIIGVLGLLQFITRKDTLETKLGAEIMGSGQFIIINKDGKKRDVIAGDILSKEDKVFSILTGIGELGLSGSKIWLDKRSEFQYLGSSGSTDSMRLIQGRIWVEGKNDLDIELKHISALISDNGVALIEQQPVYSIVSALDGSVKITSKNGNSLDLLPGNRIMVSQSNLADPGTSLASLAGKIDDSIKQNAFFIARSGASYLEKLTTKTSDTSSGSVSIGSLMLSGSNSNSSLTPNNKLVTISRPLDGSRLPGTSFRVEGSVNTDIVTSITINDTPAVISKSGSYISSPVSLGADSVDVVYKAYDSSKKLVDRGILTVYSLEKAGSNDKLIPTTFPINDKDFRFVSPAENPFKTTQSAITVSGTVPKGVVSYITVNGYKLKKFVPLSTSWYYFANTAYQTMKEGFNLYEIRFYGENDTLLSTQLFTIIKEGESTVSGE